MPLRRHGSRRAPLLPVAPTLKAPSTPRANSASQCHRSSSSPPPIAHRNSYVPERTASMTRTRRASGAFYAVQTDLHHPGGRMFAAYARDFRYAYTLSARPRSSNWSVGTGASIYLRKPAILAPDGSFSPGPRGLTASERFWQAAAPTDGLRSARFPGCRTSGRKDSTACRHKIGRCAITLKSTPLKLAALFSSRRHPGAAADDGLPNCSPTAPPKSWLPAPACNATIPAVS